ncbi:putative disease resistance protein RGA1 [Chenopodium quinoa]|uniref:putative disease resistance protein RGA1 n=1 Tax=Chenopodium quinoa TaxID=63459 RepID=UPI000B791232|nr:putative disease resistance protein RGA1 [Chenopodium quinoa]
MLPDSDDAHQGVKFLSIVGPGGLGKTALARLVYNHERVVSAFSLRLWTCVSDQDQKQFDVKEIFNQILRSCLQQMDDGPADQTQDRLMGQVAGRKFLLILDDVWTENLDQWLKLAEFFMAGRRGCWIVVTTRSRETTKIIGNGPVYELQGLSEENSWGLFEKMAFEQEIPPEDLVKIGRKIVERCAGVPLAVWVVGSLLHGQGKSKWLSIQEFGLADIRNSKNIMPLLKLSYSHLGSSLKSCFNYCALFPKGFEIEKEWLISLWMAQGFVVPLDETQSIEDAGEEYFSLLFQRCFFQDIQIDEYGEVVSCKINALMHDIAEESAGNEICVANPFTCNMDGKGHHLSVIRSKSAVNVFRKSQIRTYLQVGRVDQLSTEQLLENMTCLRSLVLKDSGIQSLPNSIDKLLHLRCLDLSDNVILEVLPESITNLHNLQTLVLRSCIRLKALPKDLSKLVKLRVLDVVACYRFTSIPSDLGKLTCLHTLTKFPVKASSSLKQCSDQLEGLKALKNLRGQLEIHIQLPKNLKYVKQGYMEVSYLRSKDRLNYIRFCIEHAESDASIAYEEAMLEDLQPHSNLRGLVLFGYHCVRMPGWAGDDSLATFLPNLVRLELSYCHNLQYLPILASLNHLKFLSIFYLPDLEYIDSFEAGLSEHNLLFFHCLKSFGYASCQT